MRESKDKKDPIPGPTMGQVNPGGQRDLPVHSENWSAIAVCMCVRACVCLCVNQCRKALPPAPQTASPTQQQLPPGSLPQWKVPKVTSRGMIRILSCNRSLERWEGEVSVGGRVPPWLQALGINPPWTTRPLCPPPILTLWEPCQATAPPSLPSLGVDIGGFDTSIEAEIRSKSSSPYPDPPVPQPTYL